MPEARTLVNYYPYGKTLRQYKECNQNRYLSTHHERDKDTGYDNRGARLYDSEIGRFLGVDPLADQRSWLSSYNYVQNNPIMRVDPTGALDTINMNRVYNDELSDDNTNVWDVLFTITSNGVETLLDDLPPMYMVGQKEGDDRNRDSDGDGVNDDKNFLLKDSYKLTYGSMTRHPEWDNTLRVHDTGGVFIHPSSGDGWLAGCKALCTQFESSTIDVYDETGTKTPRTDLTFSSGHSKQTLQIVRNTYDKYLPQLTGEKFLIKNAVPKLN